MFHDKRNVVLNLDNRHFTHYMEMDHNVHVYETNTDNILSKTIENTNYS